MQTEQHHVVWQQNGDEPNFGAGVCNFLDKKFRLWICRCGPVRWHLGPHDLTLRGVSSHRAQQQMVRVLQMKEQISVEFSNLHPDKDD